MYIKTIPSKSMNNETRAQIDTDAIAYAIKTYGERSEVLEASIIWDDGKADFAAGATHQHPIVLNQRTGGAEKMKEHQNKLSPKQNKFHKGNGRDGKHYWLTPPELYKQLNDEFHFDFDPCPYPKPDEFDGLTCEWGESNYVNPPFGSIIHHGKKKGPTAWVRKAIEEHNKGRTVVLVYPIDKWILMILKVIGCDVRNLGDVRWCATEDGSPGKGTGRHIACFILKAKNDKTLDIPRA